MIERFLARFTASLIRQSVSQKIEERKEEKKNRPIPDDGKTRCPECGTPYDLNDYREDVEEIFCSTCKAKLK